MTPTRKFLGLDRPALDAVVDWLLDHFARPPKSDLRHVTVVVPGSRAGRRLLELLVDRAEAASLELVPPRITTVGQFPELLYQAKRPFADDIVQRFAWTHALRKFDSDELRTVIATRPDEHDFPRWLDLGRLISDLHEELTSEGLDFAEVVELGAQMPGFSETKRWRTLARLQRAYLDTLDELDLWDCQSARLFAIRHGECHVDGPTVLVATVDLNRSVKQMLIQLSEPVWALVAAPEEWADRFDPYGCLAWERWQEVDLGIPEESIRLVDDPAAQSEAAVRLIAEWNGRFRPEQITIGVLNEQIVPQLIRQLDECQIPNRYGPGRRIALSGVYRLLEDISAYSSSGRYTDFARLTRHPDIEAWLIQGGCRAGWIEELDDYYNEHLPRHMGDHWLGDPESSGRLRDVQQRLSSLSRGLAGPPKVLTEWLSGVEAVMHEVYGQRKFNLNNESDRRELSACLAVESTLEALMRLPRTLAPIVTGADATQIVLDRIAVERVAPAADESAIELVGWLELPLDDAPGLIVTNFNDGFVPSSLNADLFLPDGLRTTLGLDDNARRYARDAYSVTSLLALWRDTRFVVGRRNHNDDPLRPSRLLFATPPAIVARRAQKFFGSVPNPADRQRPAGGLKSGREVSGFAIPRPQPLTQPITRMSVTSFKAYLACPYRYYLSHVLRLRSVDDQGGEMDGASFGGLAHAVLEQFGRDEDLRASTNAEIIANSLNHRLNILVSQRLGQHPGTALLVQIEQLRSRLRSLARWQAEWAAEGWRIEHAEVSFADRPARFIVDDQPMLLTGRIDRIDRNVKTGDLFLLDYKTADAGYPPEKTHRTGKGEWIDLQLPLYRHLARELGIDGSVSLGYIILPKRLEDVGLEKAEWSEKDLMDADAAARDVVRKIRDQEFWPPAEALDAYHDPFAAICMEQVFGSHRAAAPTKSEPQASQSPPEISTKIAGASGAVPTGYSHGSDSEHDQRCQE